MSSTQIFAVLMAGGSGTRFWPASRRAKPKQFLRLSGRQSLIRATWERLKGLVPPERVLVVAGEAHADLVRKHLPALPSGNLLCEPVGRNTTACIAWAACEIERRAPQSVQLVLPSDHVIRPAKRFRELVQLAADAAAAEDVLVTLGVRPSSPATGFGYIERGGPAGPLLQRVARFVEKPARERAEEFVASGNFLWNAGIFVWSTAAILKALREFAPQTLAGARAFVASGVSDAYATLEAQSIDRSVLERARNVRVVPVDFEWSDVGSWEALGDLDRGRAELVALESSNCIVWTEKDEVVALLGVSDLVVVHAGKVTLVCPRERAQDVRLLVAELERRGGGSL
jgi:mannose-1-phosphate guanylyltransferase